MQNSTNVLVIVLVVLLVVLVFGGFGMMGFGMTLAPHASAGVGGGMMNGMMGGYGYGYNPLGGIISLAVWALISGGVVLLVVSLARNAGKTFPQGESPLDILKARYARGEINKEQFVATRRDLGV